MISEPFSVPCNGPCATLTSIEMYLQVGPIDFRDVICRILQGSTLASYQKIMYMDDLPYVEGYAMGILLGIHME